MNRISSIAMDYTFATIVRHQFLNSHNFVPGRGVGENLFADHRCSSQTAEIPSHPYRYRSTKRFMRESLICYVRLSNSESNAAEPARFTGYPSNIGNMTVWRCRRLIPQWQSLSSVTPNRVRGLWRTLNHIFKPVQNPFEPASLHDSKVWHAGRKQSPLKIGRETG